MFYVQYVYFVQDHRFLPLGRVPGGHQGREGPQGPVALTLRFLCGVQQERGDPHPSGRGSHPDTGGRIRSCHLRLLRRGSGCVLPV
jgi:hypothetical protein